MISFYAALRHLAPYKSSQSQLPRAAIAALVGVVFLLVLTRLTSLLIDAELPYYKLALALEVFSVSLIVIFTHNIPRVADFLINTHCEMQRVVWPSLRYIINSLNVIAVAVGVLAILVFVIDMFWNVAFELAGFLILA